MDVAQHYSVIMLLFRLSKTIIDYVILYVRNQMAIIPLSMGTPA
jgi:hypothetical protein